MTAAKVEYVDQDSSYKKGEPRANVIRRTIQRVIDKEGSITSNRLVELAKSKRFPLNKDFEWDNDIAGHRHRLKQATDMILAQRLIVQVTEHDDGTARAVARAASKVQTQQVRKLISRGRNMGYIPRPEAVDDTEVRQHMVEVKISQLRTWLGETVDLEQFSPELKKLRKVITKNLPKDA